jgi:hypothetical protein
MTRGRENPACSITETGKRADSVRMLHSHHSPGTRLATPRRPPESGRPRRIGGGDAQLHGGGASEPLIQIGDLRSRRSKGGSNLLTTNRTVASRVPGRFRPCREKDFRWKTKAGKCPNT